MFLYSNSKNNTQENKIVDVDDEKTPKSIKLWMVLTILVTMCLMSTMVFQHLMHIQLSDEITQLKSEVRVLTMKSQNPFSMNWVIRNLKKPINYPQRCRSHSNFGWAYFLSLSTKLGGQMPNLPTQFLCLWFVWRSKLHLVSLGLHFVLKKSQFKE